MDNTNNPQNIRLKKHTFVFGILMLFCQAGIIVAYSLGFEVKASTINISSVINAILLAILVVAGFGMTFSYIRRLVWSGIGYTFFITACCIEFYPIINNFWTRTAIDYNTAPTKFDNSKYSLYLVNASLPSSQLYGNCITNSLKCALAVAAAFSSILGRSGPLQCLITVIFGTIGYQLNRQVIVNLAVDGFGTYTIFTFAGFMGLALGVILKYKQDKMEETSTQMHPFNIGSDFSVLYALFGSLIIFALFPILAYQIDVSNNFNVFNLQNGPLSILIGMGAAVLGSFCLSTLIHGRTIMRDIIHSPIAGGIVVGSSSIFITNPVYALVAGFAAGVTQTIIQAVQRHFMRRKSVVSTVSWTLFGIQGIIGGVFATGYKKIIDSHSNNFIYNEPSKNFNPGYQLLIAIISAGIGLAFGIIASIFIYLASAHRSSDHFTDKAYWQSDNGISYPNARQILVAKPGGKIISKIKDKPSPIEGGVKPDGTNDPVKVRQPSIEGEDVRESHSSIENVDILDMQHISEFEFEMQFSQPSEAQAYYHAYL